MISTHSHFGERQKIVSFVTRESMVYSETDAPENFDNPAFDLSGIRVLIVDDEPDARDLFAVSLNLQGAEVVSVATAVEALAIIESFAPDILVSDIGMPYFDGYSLMQSIRSLPPEKGGQIPAIALTAYAGEIDQQISMDVGFQRHITKPIDPYLLIQTILELLPSQENQENSMQ